MKEIMRTAAVNNGIMASGKEERKNDDNKGKTRQG